MLKGLALIMEEEKRKNIVIKIVLAIIFLTAIAGSWDIRKYIGHSINNTKTIPVKETNTLRNDILTNSNGEVSKYLLIYYIHEMANCLVMADNDQKWGFREINKENIELVYNTAIELKDNDKDKKKLVSIAERWKKHDFSKIVEDHNMVWEMQGGNVGRAKSSNVSTINDVLARLD